MRMRKATRMGTLFTAVTLASMGVASAAHAQIEPGFNAPQSDKSVSLTIHKHEGNDTLEEYTGQEQDLGSAAISDVTFSVQEVGFMENDKCQSVDLASPASWEKIAKATPSSVCNIGEAVTGKTDNSGIAKFTNLSQRLYKVMEIDGGKNLIKAPSTPFLVTLPMPVRENKWFYDVHVYPKNTLTEPGELTKAPSDPVDDQGKAKFIPGSIITWTITANVPQVGLDYKEVTLTDTVPTGLEITGVTSVKFGETALNATEHYSVEGGTIKLTEAGLGTLNPLVKKSDVKVVVELKTKVTKDISVGKTENKVQLSLNGKTKETSGTTYWGNLKVTKQDKADKKPLANAVFSVYAGKCADSGALVAEGLKTDADGVISHKLYVGKSDDATKDYCLKESAAPAGYILDSTGIDFTLSVANDQFTKNVTFDNVKVTGPHLPLTGAQGTALLTGAGILLLAVGAGTVYHARRRS